MGSLIDWDHLAVGQRVNLVVHVVCRNLQGDTQCHIAQSIDRRAQKLRIQGVVPHTTTTALLNVQVIGLCPVQVAIDDASVVLSVPPCHASDLVQVVELCSGIGVWSSVVSHVQMQAKAGVDHNPVWESLFHKLHPGPTKFVCGDLASPAVVQQLSVEGCHHGVLVVGISCQPHSALGDRRSMQDERSATLPAALCTAWMLQSAVVVLECVPGVLTDVAFQAVLKGFVALTGYNLCQTVLKLSDAWCSRRDRWFGVLSAPILGSFALPAMPSLGLCPQVSMLFPDYPVLGQDDLAQLQLNLYELSKYHAYAVNGVEQCYLQLDGQAPTLLHSAGNQMYVCACGCRQALSEARLKSRGLVGILIPLGTYQKHMHINMQHCRYLHPAEMFALLGGSPLVDLGPNHRLAMAGVGQCVAPLMAIWTFAHVRKLIDGFLGLQLCCPDQLFQDFAKGILQECALKWPRPVPVEPTVDDPIEDVTSEIASESSSGFQIAVRWCQDDTTHLVSRLPHATARHVLQAETALVGQDVPDLVRVAGELMDLDLCLQEGMVLDFGLQPPVPAAVTGLQSVGTDLSVAADWNVYAVSTMHALKNQRQDCMPKSERLRILDQQGPVWGDDELLDGLRRIAHETGGEQHVHVWDPLLITGLFVDSQSRTWSELVSCLGVQATAISAVVVDTHWYPLVWRMDDACMRLFTCGVSSQHGAAMDFLSNIVGVHRTGEIMQWNSLSLDFLPVAHCGAVALAFVKHLLWGDAMVASQDQVEEVASLARGQFANELTEACMRPRLAALGLEPTGLLGELLLQHGVPIGEVPQRVAHIQKTLGDQVIVDAMHAENPWQEIKWHANQQRSPMMLIKPSELQRTIAQRMEKQVGSKRHKTPKGKGNGKAGRSGQPTKLDPNMLRLETGLFQTKDGLPLQQVPLAGWNAEVSGVVLTSLALALPYLQTTQPLSSGALGFLVLDCHEAPPTERVVEAVRVPLVCATNAEPLLADAYLVQFGVIPVVRAPKASDCAIQAVDTCVVKAMVYRDLTGEDWSDVVAHPLQHVFSKIPPLQVCQEAECLGCEAWHHTPQYPLDMPVVELWGKQWMRLNFTACSPDKAEVFTVHLRIPEMLQHVVQEFSGYAGVFLEPKSIDGRKPSELYQVIWFPKASLDQLDIQRRTIKEVCGIARMGHKLGLRCKVEHAAIVFQTTKPGMTFLPAGKRQFYRVGPFPFGTLKHSVALALEKKGWTARPLQPLPAGAHVQGLMFKVQAVTEPPNKVLQMAHGDVVVTKEDMEVRPVVETPKVVAAPATMAMVARDHTQIDELQLNDPWARPAKPDRKTQNFPIGSPVEDMETRIVAQVLAQMPKPSMEVDSEVPSDARLTVLEQQVSDLHKHTASIQQALTQQATEHAGQYQELQQQVTAQGVHMETALAAQTSHLQSFQDAFQEQFRQQVSHQQAMLDGMFTKQMSQFESLLAKRHKPE